MRFAPAERLARASARAIVLAAGLALAACSTTPTASVLRFHNQPISRGTVYIQPANPQMAGSLEFRAQANAVGAELQRNGFTVVQSPPAQFNAIVNVQTSERMTAGRQSGVSIGVGGGFSSGNVGMGTSVQVPVGGQSRPNVATTTTLSVSIVQSGTNTAVWEGRSSLDTEAGGQSGTALTPILASTMFQGFPGPSGQTVQVPIR
ncbi:DUF4136 domain-containing protein [Sandaracinobacteroides hominis]|uniref:DUF4136 domain-containing protein n=1 Tax=Sandaracinobacteroides hominis TaxID=2780086 RepID=UPI0018F6D850|nr:DUF4136 domain-containing protein [Sandaracinobacteroides hominis]